jgi:hypothetical protein
VAAISEANSEIFSRPLDAETADQNEAPIKICNGGLSNGATPSDAREKLARARWPPMTNIKTHLLGHRQKLWDFTGTSFFGRRQISGKTAVAINSHALAQPATAVLEGAMTLENVTQMRKPSHLLDLAGDARFFVNGATWGHFSRGATVCLAHLGCWRGYFATGLSLSPFCQRLAVVASARNLGQIAGRPAMLPFFMGATHRATERRSGFLAAAPHATRTMCGIAERLPGNTD